MYADVAAVEFGGEVGLDLAAFLAVETGVANAFAGAVETADMEIAGCVERAAVIEVEPVGFVIDADRAGNRAAFFEPGLRDEVDHPARRVRGKGRGRAAADRLDTADIAIGAHEIVGIAEHDIAEFEDREPVFLQLDIARAAGRDRNAANRDVGIAFAARGFRTDAGDLADEIGGRAGVEIGDRFRVERADRDRAFQPVLALCDRGDDDDIVTEDGVAIGSGCAFLSECGGGYR